MSIFSWPLERPNFRIQLFLRCISFELGPLAQSAERGNQKKRFICEKKNSLFLIKIYFLPGSLVYYFNFFIND